LTVTVTSPPGPPLRTSATFKTSNTDAERGARAEIQVKMSELLSEGQPCRQPSIGIRMASRLVTFNHLLRYILLKNPNNDSIKPEYLLPAARSVRQ
jgi:hypothetical protein